MCAVMWEMGLNWWPSPPENCWSLVILFSLSLNWSIDVLISIFVSKVKMTRFDDNNCVFLGNSVFSLVSLSLLVSLRARVCRRSWWGCISRGTRGMNKNTLSKMITWLALPTGVCMCFNSFGRLSVMPQGRVLCSLVSLVSLHLLLSPGDAKG